MRIFLLTLSLCGTLTLYAQVDLTKRVSLDVKNVRLDKLFQILETNHGVIISFGIDNIPAQVRISLSAKNKPIYEILQIICSQTGLVYQIIDSAVVFKYARPPRLPGLARTTDTTDVSFTAPGDRSIHAPGDTLSTDIVGDPVTIQPVQSSKDSSRSTLPLDSQVTSDVVPKGMTKSNAGNPTLVSSLFSTAEKQSRLGFYGAGIFFSYAIDYNRFHFIERDIAFQQYKVDWNQSLSVGGYVIVSSKLYVRAGVGYATKDFVLNYNYRVLDPDDPFPIPNKTNIEIHYLEVPLTFGYGILTKRKYSLCVAAGFYPSYLIEKGERTTYLNNGDPSTRYFIDANRSTLYSGTIGIIIHYSIGNSCGVFIEPMYLYVLGAVNEKAMQPNSSLYRIKAGLQFPLFHNK